MRYNFFFRPEEKIKTVLNLVGTQYDIKVYVDHPESVFLATADGVMVALAEVSHSDQHKIKQETVLAKHIETKTENLGYEAVDPSRDDKWEVQATTDKTIKKKNSRT